MRIQISALLIFLLIPSFHTQWFFPMPEYLIGTPCKKKDGAAGTYKNFVDCKNDNSKQLVGVIEGTSEFLVCCEKKTHQVGDAAGRYCTNDRSSWIQPGGFRVLYGNVSEVGEFPHMAALGFEDFDGGVKFDCGGALISENFVLTAAHCFIRDTPKFVRVGKTSLKPYDIIDTRQPVDVMVKRIIRHESYTARRKYDDIALIELAEPVAFNEFIKPVCLQVHGDSHERERNLTVIGFGISDSNTRQKSDWLMKAVISEMALDECRAAYDTAPLDAMPNSVRSSQLCARDLKKVHTADACQGDSGSPIQYIAPGGRYYAVGVVSFGRGCGSNFPSIYTRISEYISWIENIVWPSNEI